MGEENASRFQERLTFMVASLASEHWNDDEFLFWSKSHFEESSKMFLMS